MDDRLCGWIVRQLRRHRGMTQAALAARAGVSQQLVSDVECGHLERVGLRQIRRIAAVLDASVALDPRWRGPALARLRDAAHAALVDAVVTELRSLDWDVAIEWSFNHFGERGSIDVVAWSDASRALLVSEVKSTLVDTQDVNAGIDRKARIARLLLPEERGWRPKIVGRVLVLPAGSTAYDTVRRHGATFTTAFPTDTRGVRRWLRAPDGDLSGIWFIRHTALGGDSANGRAVRPWLVRRSRSRR
jgi:transcriptional regulator with XRE-family HTH domain